MATQEQSEVRNDAGSFTSSFNISLTTSALRGCLECEVIKVSAAQWLDGVDSVYPNRFDKSTPGYVLLMTVSTSDDFTVPVFSAPRRLACCTNDTYQSKQSVIAYWSSNDAVYDQRSAISVDPNEPEDIKVPSGWTKDFAIKYIVGSAVSATVPGTESNFISNTIGLANESVLYFTEEPQISNIKCSPIIEQVNASITLLAIRAGSSHMSCWRIHNPLSAPGSMHMMLSTDLKEVTCLRGMSGKCNHSEVAL